MHPKLKAKVIGRTWICRSAKLDEEYGEIDLEGFHPGLRGVAEHIKKTLEGTCYGISSAEDHTRNPFVNELGIFTIYGRKISDDQRGKVVDPVAIINVSSGIRVKTWTGIRDELLEEKCRKIDGSYNQQTGEYEGLN